MILYDFLLSQQKEEKQPEVRAPPPPVLRAKQDGPNSQKRKKKQPEEETLIHTDATKDCKPIKVVQGTQNTRIKEAQQPPIKSTQQNAPEKETIMVPKQDNNKDKDADVKQCKTETKSNIPWYLQD